MIWGSTPLMTVFDLAVMATVAFSIAALVRSSLFRQSSRSKFGPKLIIIGALTIGLFYFFDLLSMHALPLVVPKAEAMAFMENLHHNLQWFFMLFAIVSIASGFLIINRGQRILIQESNERFKDMAEASSDWFWEIDANLRYTFFSDRYEEFTGFKIADRLGTRRGDFGHPSVAPEKWAAHQADLEARRPFKNFEYASTATDRDIIYCSSSGIPVFDDDGAFVGYRGTTTNITERKRDEEALRESDERFRALFHCSPLEIHIKDCQGRYLLVNEAYAKWRSKSPEQIKGKTSFDLFSDDLAAAFIAHDREVLETGRAIEREIEVPTSSDVPRQLWVTKFPIFGSDGIPAAIGTVNIDITERKKSENSLKKSDQRLRGAIDSMQEGFALFGADDRLIAFNKEYLRIRPMAQKFLDGGGTFEETIRAYVKEGIIPEAKGREEEFIKERLELHCNPKGPLLRQLPGGQWYMLNESRTPEGGTAISFVNITEQKQAEEDVKKSEAKLGAILDIAPEAVITTGGDMKIQLFNKGAERIFGYSANEVMGQSLDILIPEHFREGHQEHIQGFKNSENTYLLMSQRNDISARCKDGTEFPASASVSKLEVAGENIYTVMLQDITERKHAQDRMMAAKNEAEAATRAKSEFLAAMSHDLRTPLNAILGFADILTNQYLGPINDKYREYAADIHSSGEHLLTLVNETLDLSTIEAGKQSLVKEKLQAEEIITECVKIVGEKACNNDIKLIIETPDKLPLLYADRRATKQILINLLSNAVKFTPAGGKVMVSAIATKQNFGLKVADTGKGIPAENLPFLTDPFNRLNDDPYLSELGWGLGLSITKSLIDLHEGEMSIKSKVGKGTTVTVTFPNDVS